MDEHPGVSRLRISASQSGDTGAVIRFVRRCAREFGFTGPWGFEWAHVCSKPMLHSFGGGALVLELTTGNTLAWNDTHGWLARQLAKAGRTDVMNIPSHGCSNFRTLLRAAADIAITPSGHLAEGNSCAQDLPSDPGDPDRLLPASGSDGPT